MYLIEIWDRYNNYRCHYTLTGTLSEAIIEAKIRWLSVVCPDDIYSGKVYQLEEDGKTKSYIGRF
jgi:hypothetical protein